MRYLFVLILSISSWAFSQTKISWNENRPLKWTDFTGNIDRTSEHRAVTYSGIEYNYSFSISAEGEVSVEAEIGCFFIQEYSWSYHDSQTKELLKHEQLRFDISELHARKMRKRVAEYDFTEDAENEMAIIYAEVMQELMDMQVKYDEETNHSKNTEKQKEWNALIQSELNALSDYK